MRIAFLSTSSLLYPSALGRWFPLAREMTRLGHTVHFVTLHHDFTPSLRRPRRRDGVYVHYVGPMHVRGWGDERRPLAPLPLLGVALRSTLALLRRALALEVDAYHVCKPQPMNGLAGWLAARWRRRPLYLDCDDYEAGANRFTGGGQQAVVRCFEDRLPRCAAGVTVNTHALERRVQGQGVPADRIFYVPNGVEQDRFAGLDPAQGRRLRLHYGLEGKATVLYLGTLNLSSHPLGLLLQAFAYLSQSLPQAHLVMVGGGEDRARLEGRVRDMGLPGRVTFTGAIAPQEVPAYFLLGDVSVDPVYDDAVARARSPLKIFESMACGVPVVAGDVGDRREILAEGRAGRLVPPGDARLLAQGLQELLLQDDLRAQLSAASLEQVQRYYWQRLVHRFLAVYGEAA
ncbi:MAG: glycosyltransferase family 4 protein [Chloroflexia bacterium]|nr:glycosyltransferase family 4 protein [Chloroflexia bacterium]